MTIKGTELIKQSTIVLTLLGLSACSQSTKDQSTVIVKASSVNPLYVNEIIKSFSTNLEKDTLRVTITGETIITGQVNLKITDFSGKSIYWDTFPASGLITHTGLINPDIDVKSIKSQLASFFDSAQFSNPTQIDPNPFKTSDSVKIAWIGLQSDSSIRCFSYQNSKNEFTYIAFSRNLQKILCLKQSKG